jgi:GNAT superfamily N-acetyltransferase
MNFEVLPMDPLVLTKEEWKPYHEFRRKRHMETKPEDPIIDDESMERTIKVQFQNPEFDAKVFTIRDPKVPDTMIGEFVFITFTENAKMFENNKHLAILEISLLPEYRRKGIGRKLLVKAYRFAKESGKGVLILNTSEPSGRSFIKEIGAQEALTSAENRLHMNEVDWEMMESWSKDGPVRSDGSMIQFFSTVPEEIVEPYCVFFTEVANQAPLDELDINDLILTPETLRKMESDREAMGLVQLVAITTESNGDISGLTEITYRPERETMLSQGLTGVQEIYRGKGLGKWLKAAMLLQIRKDFPKVKIVSTGNANSNAPMLAINKMMGFKLHKEKVDAQITVDQLEQYLEKHALLPRLQVY